MTARLYIARHGNTFDKGDTVLRVGGRTDLDLSASGRVQAAALGAHFANSGIAFERVISGPLKRTLQTADAIAAEAFTAGEVEIVEGLREVDYGPDEAQPEDLVIARIGQAALDAWEHEAIVPEGWQVDPDALVDVWRAILEQARARGGNTLAVTSNGIARFALPAIGMSGEALAETPLKLRTGAYGVIGMNGAPGLVNWDVRPD